jgi:peptidoglycan/xylan/chitin deacetylase (PgdA/CDA1 family)
MENYICIHAHFYQPPRENPWLEAIERQESAAPWHDWNERITAECYLPNGIARMLDARGRIDRGLNNYSRISFNFGPTLLGWLETNDPWTYRRILAADRESAERFSGHGSALAQAYNHAILPLCNRRDKRTQIVWGIRDFTRRFNRQPEGMWLPETAVDLETLDIMAELGLKFAILAPHQARRVRRRDEHSWHNVDTHLMQDPRGVDTHALKDTRNVDTHGRDTRDVDTHRRDIRNMDTHRPDTRDVDTHREDDHPVDPCRSYEILLPSGRTLALFFYNGPISLAVGFQHLLNDGNAFINRLMDGFAQPDKRPRLVHMAVDGETFGHHHRFGEMALAYALNTIETGRKARLTNYGEFLEKHPPTYRVDIQEGSSWSCAHGIGRWKEHCGCHTGAHPGWQQLWRTPLRKALDWLRDRLAALFAAQAPGLLRDPWAARDDYIDVVLHRSPESLGRFFGKHQARALGPEDRVRALKLLEMQRHALLMYTSCGWFFDDLAGIETLQILQYAGRAVELGEELSGEGEIEALFLAILEKAKSNRPEMGSGSDLYRKFVRPAMMDHARAAALYAVRSLVGEDEERDLYAYTIESRDSHTAFVGGGRMAAGRCRVTSKSTLEAAEAEYAAVLTGDPDVRGGIRLLPEGEPASDGLEEIVHTFEGKDLSRTLELVLARFGPGVFSLESLIPDERRRMADALLESSGLGSLLGDAWEEAAPLCRLMSGPGMEPPETLRLLTAASLRARLERALDVEEPRPEAAETIIRLMQDAESWNIELDRSSLERRLRSAIERAARAAMEKEGDAEALKRTLSTVGLAAAVGLQVNLYGTQNIFFEMRESAYPGMKAASDRGDEAAAAWLAAFMELGEALSINPPDP